MDDERPDERDVVARWTGDAGDPASARYLYAALLPVLEQVLGAGHPDTLAALANLATWTTRARPPRPRDLTAQHR